MPGPVFTTGESVKRAVAFNNQVTAGTAVVLTTADLLDCSSVTVRPNPQTATDPRYTGSADVAGDQLIGVSHEISFEWIIHGFGGGALPALGAFIGGRVMSWIGMTEARLAAAVTGTYTVGTDTSVTLDAPAPAIAGALKGLAINLTPIGAAPLGFAMIREYTVGKLATLARLRTGLAATGAYSVPEQISYLFSSIKPAAGASITVWEAPDHRQNFRDCRPTAARIEMNTASRDGGESYCKITVSATATLYSEANEAVPTVTGLIPIPSFRDGQQDIANMQLGGSSFVIDLGLSSSGPPNPNQVDGSDPAQITRSKRTASYTLNKHSRTVVDWNVLAKDQNQHASQAFWGIGSGNYIGVMIDNQRFNYRETGESGEFMQTTGDAWIDGADKSVCLTFVKY